MNYNSDLSDLIVDLHRNDGRPLLTTFHKNDSVISLDSSASEARLILRALVSIIKAVYL
jgi:hypothetical protein